MICGLGVLGSWVSDVIRQGCASAEPPVEVHKVDRDHVFEALGRTEGPRRVFLVDHPGRPIMDAIADGTIPVVGVLDDPIDSVRFTRIAFGCDVLQALRLQTSAASANHLLHGNPAVVLLPRAFRGNAQELIATLIDHLGLELQPHSLQALLEAFGGPVADPWPLEIALQYRGHAYSRLDQLADAVTADDAILVRQTLSPLVLGAVSPDIGAITWPARVFLFGDRPDEVAPPVADVTGAARIIYYGPYFHVPPGTWKVRIILAFSMEARGTPFRLFVYCKQKAIAKIQVTPTDGGAFEGTFTMQHLQAETPLEIHFSNDEGTIDGHVALGQITLTRLAR